MKSSFRSFFIIALMIASVLFVASQLQVSPSKTAPLSFSEFIQMVDEGKVESVTFRGQNEILGKYKPDYKSGAMFQTLGNTNSEFYLKRLEEKGITPNFEKEPERSFLETALISWVPTFLILFIFFL